MHRDSNDEDVESVGSQQPRLLVKDPDTLTPTLSDASGQLSGIYQHVSRLIAIDTSSDISVLSCSALPFSSHLVRQSFSASSGGAPVAFYEQDRWVRQSARGADDSIW
jgi:hypothetical protein